ncbi:hypothetical protein [Streptomyces sp. CAI-85]|uniref:hypothetical protein n=1 Tax=Streptomyces sp. CAI-85 TaxID=1472662 RepID=UPI00158720DE|nr:hypothetical protein [Streptomyces sp. CAI-85]NUV62774.1 hypothetical protein [Streptomyces sp. CAI-85]
MPKPSEHQPSERADRTRPRGRRGALWGASAAAVVCAGVVLGGCGGDGGPGGGFAAVGPAGGGATTGMDAAPTGGVRFIPLDGPPSNSPTGEGSPRPAGSSAAPAVPGPTTAPAAPSGTPAPSVPPRTEPGPAQSPVPPRPSAPAPTPDPAALTTGTPVRAATDLRWCEDVTLDFHNSGGTAVRSGTVVFGTHVIGALGIDWATVDSTVPLPTPIAPGTRKRRTWTVCVDSWRVPLGMHVETRDVSVRWE